MSGPDQLSRCRLWDKRLILMLRLHAELRRWRAAHAVCVIMQTCCIVAAQSHAIPTLSWWTRIASLLRCCVC